MELGRLSKIREINKKYKISKLSLCLDDNIKTLRMKRALNKLSINKKGENDREQSLIEQLRIIKNQLTQEE